MKQFHHFKQKYADAVLFFRMGDFYETFYEDAHTCSRVLGLTLTSRNKNSENPVPLAGLPYHAVDGYLKKMLQAGYKVAVCEQIEDPKQAKGVVKRDVVRVVTPGTLTDDQAALPTDAKWYLDSQSGTLFGSGQTVMVSSGGHVINFVINSSTPYIAPSPMAKTITSSSANQYAATYIAAGFITVYGNCPAGLGYGGNNFGRWRVVGETEWGYWGEVKIPTGSKTIEFDALNDLEKPANKTYSITKNIPYTKNEYYRLLNIYVDRINGSNSNNGTEYQPFQTIQWALSKIGSYGTIWLKNSEYYESLSFPTDRTIYLKNNSGSQWVDIHNTHYQNVPGNINRIGVRFEGQF